MSSQRASFEQTHNSGGVEGGGSKRQLARKLLFKSFFSAEARHGQQTASTAGDGQQAAAAIDQKVLDEGIEMLKAQGNGDDIATSSNVRFAMDNNYSQGSVHKAVELIQFFKDAADGVLVPIMNRQKHYYKLLGADNYRGVTCYIDALLFAMFARLESFEPILFKNFEHDSRKEYLSTFLRFYVNLLRSGKPITTDITRGLMDAIFDAGWVPSFDRYEQQDSSELFNFITETLDMPLLTLKVDIAHGGKEVIEDDHKIINESLLHVPVPGNTSDGPILLEECLELYFANSVNVSRQLERRRTLDSTDLALRPSLSTRKLSVSVNEEECTPATRLRSHSGAKPASFSVHVEEVDADSAASSPRVDEEGKGQLRGEIVQEGNDEQGKAEENKEGEKNIEREKTIETGTKSSPGRPRAETELPTYESLFKSSSAPNFGSSSKKGSGAANSLWTPNMEITLPAWMFLQLLPFYSDTKASDGNNTESPISQHFANSRPVLGMCLKRYYWTEAGHPKRNGRMVIVPQVIHLPSFVADDRDKDANVFGNFKLVLESAVFHRGNSLNSGHFVTLVAENPTVAAKDASRSTTSLTSKRSLLWRSLSTKKDSSSSHQEDNEEVTGIDDSTGRRWLLFDDLAEMGQKVQPANFEEVFKNECPYLLFYRMVQIDTEESEVEDQDEEEDGIEGKDSLEIPEGPRRRSYQTLLGMISRSASPERPPEQQQQQQQQKPQPPSQHHHHKKHRSLMHRTHRDNYRAEKCLLM
ncbi:hypothetical protein TRICI_004398 [Trichomonascus ciferrii]|uniref:ubiquitinyl hydrolase 1 n=1 Tax=Trichomonascus ciferrii TaxID=44093 RepID=A0A642V199_9ASCO|nr:hypothetical protein TRICI_004398 [Trichomonascus ciferrii]